MAHSRTPLRRRIRTAVSAAVATLAVAAVCTTGILIAGYRSEEPLAQLAVQVPTPVVASSRPVVEAGFPENTEAIDIAALVAVDVFSVVPALAVDDGVLAEPLGLLATPVAAGAPLFRDPTGEPVGVLPATLTFDGTTVPVVERQRYWVRILLSGRAGLPSQGVVGQLTAWVRTADVTITPAEASVRVHLAASTIEIVEKGSATVLVTSFGSGRAATPTPVGRTFIMTTRVDPHAGYTRGHPIVYLAVQSLTLDGFNGQNNAITAFHYHDDRTGPISNGCLRVDAETITRLAALPLGTPVTIWP